MTNQELCNLLVEACGGKENFESATNCMTRLRVKLKDKQKADLDKLKGIEGVLGVVDDVTTQIVVGPGKAKKLCDVLVEDFGIVRDSGGVTDDWKENKESLKSTQKESAIKNALRTIGEIFIPLIPAIIAAGIFNGFSGLIGTMQNTGGLAADSAFWTLLKNMFGLIGGAFLSYFAIFTGVNAARKFGATEALGGMIGAISIMTQINPLSEMFGLYNAATPLKSILTTGKGGIIGVVIGVWVLAKVERYVRKNTPDVLDLIVTPIVSLLVVSVLFVFAIMPASGFISDWLVSGLSVIINTPNPIVSVISGFILAALFLPMVLLGLHHGLIPIYAIQLEQMGGVSLFPVLAMAGAGQVGAAIAIYLKAKRSKNTRIKKVIAGALPAGFLGIGEPLIYGVTLPLGKPFITAGLGAGFGGAFVMLTNVMATAWGPSGIVAIPLMQPNSMLNFVIGLLISYVAGFIITYAFIKDDLVARA